jgi:hypothetical protein
VLGKEARQALLAQVRSALRCRVAADEGKSDRRVHVGEDIGGAGPERLEQAPELIGERDAAVDQIVTRAYQGPKRAQLVALRLEGAKAMPVGAQDVGQHVGVAGVVLTRAAVAGARGLEHVGMDRHDSQTRFDERIDEQTGRSLDCDEDAGEALELADQAFDAFLVVRQIEAQLDTAGSIEHANGVRLARPVDAGKVRTRSHGQAPWCWSKTSRAGRPGGELIKRRSGFSCLARHPVSRLSLPAPSAQRVSLGPSSGQHRRLSQKVHGSLSTRRSNPFDSVNAVTHRLARSVADEAPARSLWITAEVK